MTKSKTKKTLQEGSAETKTEEQTHYAMSYANKITAKSWKTGSFTIDAIAKIFDNHVETDDKDGMPCLLAASLTRSPGPRGKGNIAEISVLIYEWDEAVKLETIKNKMLKTDYEFMLVSSHNHKIQKKKDKKPEERFRLILPLATPYKIGSEKRADHWAEKVYPLGAKKFGLKGYDNTGADANRAFFRPSHPKGMKSVFIHENIGGKHLNLGILEVEAGIIKETTVDGFDTEDWLGQGQNDFDIVRWVVEKASYLNPIDRAKGGKIITCPDDHLHKSGGSYGAFVDNANDGHGPTIFCSHEGCKGRTTAERMASIIRNPKSTASIDDLQSSEYGGSQLETLPEPFHYHKGKVTQKRIISVDLSEVNAHEGSKKEKEEKKQDAIKEEAEGWLIGTVSKEYKDKNKKTFVDVSVYDPICSFLAFKAYVRIDEGSGWSLEIDVQNVDGRRSTVLIKMGDLSERKVWLTLLRNAGMRLEHPTKVKTLEWLLERVVPDVRKKLAMKSGWNEGVFILPNGKNVDAYGETKDGEEYLLNSGMRGERKFATSGTLKEWQDNVASLAQGNSRLVFSLGAAFAPVLLKDTGGENTVYHFVGKSSRGKTVGLEVAGSVWGGPKFIRTWRNTDNALESVLVYHNDGLLCLDEIGQIEPKALRPCAYMIGNEDGKGRANNQGTGGEAVRSFRNVTLSSGEKTYGERIADGRSGMTPNAGELARFLDVPADAGKGLGVFDTVHRTEGATPTLKGHRFAQQIKKNIRTYYGTPIQAFLEWITDEKNGAVLSAIEAHVKAFESDVVPADSDGQIFRVGTRFGLVAAAGELAIEAGILPYEKGEVYTATKRMFNDWLLMRGTDGAYEIAQGIRAFNDNLQKHGNSRFENLAQPEVRVQKRIGFYEDIAKSGDEEGYRVYYVPSDQIGELVEQSEPTEILQELKKRNILTDHDKRKLTKRKTLPSLGETPCYWFRMDMGQVKTLQEDVDDSNVVDLSERRNG